MVSTSAHKRLDNILERCRPLGARRIAGLLAERHSLMTGEDSTHVRDEDLLESASKKECDGTYKNKKWLLIVEL
jgi:hypothetical protein